MQLCELVAAGFNVVSRQTSGYPAAFIAEWSQGSGGPKIGFLPEYDALPGLGVDRRRAGLRRACQAAIDVAAILATTGNDCLTNPALLAGAKEDHAKRLAGRSYVSSLPADR